MEKWALGMKENLKNKTTNFTIQEKQNINYQYLHNLLVKIENGSITGTVELKSKVELIINEMPQKIGEKRLNYTAKHLNQITNLQTFVENNFNLVKKGSLSKRYMLMGIPVGMPLGLPIGAAIGKIGLSLIIGMPFGLVIGFLIGRYLDKKAVNENRII